MSPSMCLNKAMMQVQPNSGYSCHGSGRDLGLPGIQAGYGESQDLSTEGSENPQSSCCSFSTNLNCAQHVMSCCRNYGDVTKHELKFPEDPNSGWNPPRQFSCQWEVEDQEPHPWEKRDCLPRKKVQGTNISLWRPHCISCWQILAVIMETIAIRLF